MGNPWEQSESGVKLGRQLLPFRNMSAAGGGVTGLWQWEGGLTVIPDCFEP